MIMVRANRDTEADVRPDEQLIADMATYHEELAKAGALVDASGLQPSSKGWRIRYSGKKRTVVDGPYTEAKELIAGYTIIQAKSREEALEWTKRFPNPFSPWPGFRDRSSADQGLKGAGRQRSRGALPQARRGNRKAILIWPQVRLLES
jgi:hypothetical protein